MLSNANYPNMHTTILTNAQQAHQVLARLWAWAKPRLIAGQRLTLTVSECKRSEDQSRLFHALCADLERSLVEWQGKPRTAGDWKILLVSGHAVATKLGAEMVPGLEGEFVNLRESTARMPKARMVSLIDYSQAWAAQHGVTVNAQQD